MKLAVKIVVGLVLLSLVEYWYWCIHLHRDRFSFFFGLIGSIVIFLLSGLWVVLSEQPDSSSWQAVRFALHLVAVYLITNVSTLLLSGLIHNLLLPLLQGRHPSTNISFAFLFSHLFALSVIPGFLSGLVNARFRHSVAFWVWVVPVSILVYKLLTFPASVMENQFNAALHYYFNTHFFIPDFRDFGEMFEFGFQNSDMWHGMEQLRFTAPAYAGTAYSLGSWISMHIQWPTLAQLRGRNESQKTAKEVADIIERFLSGTSLYPQEWNDFVECSQHNPTLEAFRQRCYALDPFVNCPDPQDPEAVAQLRKIVEELQRL